MYWQDLRLPYKTEIALMKKNGLHVEYYRVLERTKENLVLLHRRGYRRIIKIER